MNRTEEEELSGHHAAAGHVPNYVKKLDRRTRKNRDNNQYSTEDIARLLVLQQCNIIESTACDCEFDRYSALTKRIFNADGAMISFIDHSKQWIKSAVGFSPLALSFDRNTSLDAKFLLQEHAEVFVILHGESSADISMLARVLGFPPQFLQFYAAAAITVDQMRIGVLSVVSSTPRHFISLDERQNILDLAVAISNMLQERRIRNIQLRKQRANLLLGLNHNLGAPLTSLALVTEMLKSELKVLVDPNHKLLQQQQQARSLQHSTNMSPQASSPTGQSQGALLMTADGWSDASNTSTTAMQSLLLTNPSSGMPSGTQSVATAGHVLGLVNDIETSLQQLSLLVEMGLLLGRITSSLVVLADGSYEQIKCSILEAFHKVKKMTKRLCGSHCITWNIRLQALREGANYSHPDILMFVLISCLIQLLPHSDAIIIRATFASMEDITQRLTGDTSSSIGLASAVELLVPSVTVGTAGLIVTEIEAVGDPANLLDIIGKLDTRSMSRTDTSSDESNSASAEGSNAGSRPRAARKMDEALQADSEVEDFGGTIFAVGALLENVTGGSSYTATPKGCLFSFSIPCRVELELDHLHLFPSQHHSSHQHEHDHGHEQNMELRSAVLKESVTTEIPPLLNPLERTIDLARIPDSPRLSGNANSPIDFAPMTPLLEVDEHHLLASISAIAAEDDLFGNNTYASLSPRDPVLSLSSPAVGEGEEMQEAIDSTNAHHVAGQQRSGARLEVLVVDDSIAVRKFLSVWLAKRNCGVTVAINGKIALEMLQAKRYDLVLMDFLMPVMDGLSCLRAMQCTLPPPSPRSEQWIIGISATALAVDQAEGFKAGMHMFCSKPVDLQALRFVLEAKRLGVPFETLRTLAACDSTAALSHDHEALLHDISLAFSASCSSSESQQVSFQLPVCRTFQFHPPDG